jgi:hypothetical protein
MKSAHVYISIFVSLLFVTIPVLVYLCEFGGNGLSHDTDAWGTFGDYLNVWINVAGLILVGTLTLHIHLKDQILQVASNRPIITFEHDRSSIISTTDRTTWKLTNVGSGPALNMRIVVYYPFQHTPQLSLNYASLEVGGFKTVSVFRFIKLVASYEDLLGNNISTTFQYIDLKNTVSVGVDLISKTTEDLNLY